VTSRLWVEGSELWQQPLRMMDSAPAIEGERPLSSSVLTARVDRRLGGLGITRVGWVRFPAAPFLASVLPPLGRYSCNPAGSLSAGNFQDNCEQFGIPSVRSERI